MNRQVLWKRIQFAKTAGSALITHFKFNDDICKITHIKFPRESFEVLAGEYYISTESVFIREVEVDRKTTFLNF